MKTNSNIPHGEADSRDKSKRTALLRRWVLIGGWVIGSVSVATLVGIFLAPPPPSASPDAHVAQPPEPKNLAAPNPATGQANITAQRGTSLARAAHPSLAIPQTEPSPGMRRLVDSLVSLEAVGSTMTEEQLAAWKRNLQQLIQQGSGAVPAIREFLAKNVDLSFSGDAATELGYSSARRAMIDALGQIGGPMAEATLAEVLQSTGDPREIAALARNLEQINPGMHQQQALDAARQALEMAAQGNLPNHDVAPLFEVLQQYGGPNVASELGAMANRWDYYSAISLARLPDNGGIPSLIELAGQNSGASPGAKAVALQMLAQVATQSPDARAALLDQVRQGMLTSFNWIGLEPLLAGNHLVFQGSEFDNAINSMFGNDFKQTHVPFGNQSFYTAPFGALSVNQIEQRQALINELLAATSDPFATSMLQKAQAELSQRRLQLAGSP